MAQGQGQVWLDVPQNNANDYGDAAQGRCG